MTTDQLIEAVLFAAAKPMSARKLMDALEATKDDVAAGLKALCERLDASGGAVMLQEHGGEHELVTRPEASDAVARVIRSDVQGELTRPSLETLTVLAYRGPMTRPEIEQIRGVNCSLILRNLMLRGLAEQKDDTRLGQPIYAVTSQFLKHLGLSGVETLPDYETLRGNKAVEQVLSELEAKPLEEKPQGTLDV